LREYALENHSKQNGYKFIIESLSIQIAVNLLRNVKSNIPQQKEYVSLFCSVNIRRAIEYVYEYYNTNFSIDDMAREANLSKFHFIRVFKAETGKTPYEYMMDVEIQKAKELLKARQHTITEICFLLGFNDHSHFTKMFKKKTGCTPTEFIINNNLVVK
jgi:AraC-like DNA-binding protein